MGLQSSGSISLNNIAGEFGGSTPHSLNEYYGAANGVPTSGAISLADFYGTSSTPIGFIDFSNPTISNLTVETGANYTQNWETEFDAAFGDHPIDAVVVNKGGTNYLIVITNNSGTNSYPKDINPMRAANMVMCNIDANPDLDVWTRVNGQSVRYLSSNWYIYDPANGYDADGNSVPANYTLRNARDGSRLVVCKANNAVTVWQPERDNYYGEGIYRDYVNSSSEAPHSGYWGFVPNDPINNGSGSFTTEGFVEEYASSETSTIVITDVNSYYLTRGGDSLNKVLRTTDGYNYSVSGMSAFPNQGVGYFDDSGDYRNHYWRARTIAYGNGVWVIGRDNPSISHGSGGYGDQNTRYSIIHSTNDGLTWNISNTTLAKTNRTGNVHGVAFGNGIFMANTFHGDTSTPYLYTSTDGANWTKIQPTYNGGSWRFFDDPYSHGHESRITYGNGMFVINFARRIRLSSGTIITVNGLYSTDNGQNWKSFDERVYVGLRFVEGADIFLAADRDYLNDRNNRLVGMYRVE